MDQNKDKQRNRPKSAEHIDRLNEFHRHASLFETARSPEANIDFERMAILLSEEFDVPYHEVHDVLRYVRGHVSDLGFSKPPASLVLAWVSGLLRQRGYDIADLPANAVEVPLEHVELNIFHPTGAFAGADQNPEATSRRLAERIKSQFAVQRVYQSDVVAAHEQGLIELMDLGSVDRPHDMFITPDYVKAYGLPASSWSPNAGPARRPDVLLAHLVRFTRELQNQFAGEIHWGFFNTLLMPFLAPLDDDEMEQFCQQLIFEFAQLNAGRGGSGPRVTLDFDFDLPRGLAEVHAVGVGGGRDSSPLSAYENDLQRFNRVFLQVLSRGDRRGSPFLRPHIVFHLNRTDTGWTELHHLLYRTALRNGNPSIAVSDRMRSFGAMGRLPLNQSDVMEMMVNPIKMRGFSISAVAINLASLWLRDDGTKFQENLTSALELTLSAHRQKRMFISRLMAYGARGPLRFLRHRFDDLPFLKLDDSTQAVHLVGLLEAARLMIGAHHAAPDAVVRAASQIVHDVQCAIRELNQLHKLNMILAELGDDEVTYRMAKMDMKRYGQKYSPFLLRSARQAEPFYSAGTALFACDEMDWRLRLQLEGKMHSDIEGNCEITFFTQDRDLEQPELPQLHHMFVTSGAQRMRVAPDYRLCLNCYHLFVDRSCQDPCPNCRGGLVTDYGFAQSGYAPVSTFCRGKRVEWELRTRWDDRPGAAQQVLPLD
ncbi:MAG: hypothetical protein KDC35_10385 [Acidobacteria bacterium]|nr:hypothetical protein [Acidobacteriota bacterium]